MVTFTLPFNVSGQPAISIPLGVGENGVPIGVQVAGRVGSDNLLLQVARTIEEELGTPLAPAPGMFAA